MSHIKNYIIADFQRHYGYKAKFSHILFKVILGKCRGMKFLYWFRLCQSTNLFVSYIAHHVYLHYSNKYNIDIPCKTRIGPGLYLGHCMNIVINEKTIIGKNCSISHFVSIGTNNDTPAIIGDNVYIGPLTAIVENVTIGNNVTIGAGTVVTHSIPDNATSVGVPNKVVNFEKPGRYIINNI